MKLLLVPLLWLFVTTAQVGGETTREHHSLTITTREQLRPVLCLHEVDVQVGGSWAGVQFQPEQCRDLIVPLYLATALNGTWFSLDVTSFSYDSNNYACTTAALYTRDPGQDQAALGLSNMKGPAGIAIFRMVMEHADLSSPTSLSTGEQDFVISSAGMVVDLNQSSSAIAIIPKDSQGVAHSEAAVSLKVNTVTLVSGTGKRHSMTPRGGSWREQMPTELGALQSFVYSCSFDSAPEAAPNTTLSLKYFNFFRNSTIDLGSGLNFNVSAEEVKFSLGFTGSPWWPGVADPDGRLEVRMAIAPGFTSARESRSHRTSCTREFELLGQQTADRYLVTTQLGMVSAVEIDGQMLGGCVANSSGNEVVFWLDASSSELVISFSSFNSTLLYDPQIGLLLGGRADDGSDNLGMIIGVSVAVPVAILAVLLVVALGMAWAYWYHGRRSVAVTAAVNFEYDGTL